MTPWWALDLMEVLPVGFGAVPSTVVAVVERRDEAVESLKLWPLSLAGLGVSQPQLPLRGACNVAAPREHR